MPKVPPRNGRVQTQRSVDPGLAAPGIRTGLGLLAAGRLAEAVACFDDVVRIAPQSTSAHLNRGIALDQMGWPKEAEAAYRYAIALAPAEAEPHRRLGLVLLLQERRAEAAASFRRAAAASGTSATGKLARAYALLAESKTGQLIKLLRQVIATDASVAPAYNLLGQVLAEQGDASAAEDAFRQFLRRAPEAVGRYYDLVRIRRLRTEDAPLLDDMLRSAQRPDLHPLNRIMLYLAIAKAYEDFNLADDAMRYLLEANRMKGVIRPLDRDLFQLRAQSQINHFTSERLQRYHAQKVNGQDLIFIVGMPRSGTTLIESILARHSTIAAGQEIAFWNYRAPTLDISETDDLPRSQLAEIGRDYLATLRTIDPDRQLTDKKPDNFVWVGLIHAIFPNARIIHCVRDPVDTCLSIMRTFFAPRPDFSTEPKDLAFYYRCYMKLMQHWRTVLPADRLLNVDYESLTTSPTTEISRLLSFCSLEWDPNCLNPEHGTRKINTASLWQARQPIFRSSVGRSQKFERWLGDFIALRTLS